MGPAAAPYVAVVVTYATVVPPAAAPVAPALIIQPPVNTYNPYRPACQDPSQNLKHISLAFQA